MAQFEKDVTAVTRETYDQIATGYARKIRAMTSDTWIGEYEKSLLDKFMSLIRINNNGKVTILDIGCGNGKDTYYLAQKEHFVTIGLDYSSGMLSEAHQVYPGVGFLQADMRTLSIKDDCLSGVWANGCIYHIMKKDLNSMFSEIWRVLQPKGIFSFNFKLGSEERLEQNPRSYGGKPRFYAYYRINEISTHLKQANFKVLDVDHYPQRIFGEKIEHVWAIKNQ